MTWLLMPSGLSAPVDVYFDWIDACDEVAKDQASTTVSRGLPAFARPVASQPQGEKYSEEDGFVVNDEPDAEAAYDDED